MLYFVTERWRFLGAILRSKSRVVCYELSKYCSNFLKSSIYITYRRHFSSTIDIWVRNQAVSCWRISLRCSCRIHLSNVFGQFTWIRKRLSDAGKDQPSPSQMPSLMSTSFHSWPIYVTIYHLFNMQFPKNGCHSTPLQPHKEGNAYDATAHLPRFHENSMTFRSYVLRPCSFRLSRLKLNHSLSSCLQQDPVATLFTTHRIRSGEWQSCRTFSADVA